MVFNSVEKINRETAIATIKSYLLELQNQICHMLVAENNAQQAFTEDQWQYASGGGGITRVLKEGNFIEKAGVNFSHVFGQSLPQAATEKRPELANAAFQALGVSVVVHPLNPYIPTSHMNVRFIVVNTQSSDCFWWFGGGFDLTPYYGFIEDCIHWHQCAKAACDSFDLKAYSKYKNWCDRYFFLKHRNEARGIGGIFFDDLNEKDFATCFAFMQNVSQHYLKAYQPIIARRKSLEFGERERDFQLYRRGRYVEFNLLYDRGTLFGLQSGGRTESILMSLPPLVKWEYDARFSPGSLEERLTQDFLQPREWV